MLYFKLAVFFVALLIWPALAAADTLTLTIIDSVPHDHHRYTQGLFFQGGELFESSGLYGRSFFCRQAPGGATTARLELPGEMFAEGAAWAEGEIYLLTWREQTALVLEPETLAIRRTLEYQGEGWGLTFDGQKLWRSDGSRFLIPHRPGDFAPFGPPLAVHYKGRPVERLNELEWDPRLKVFLANIYGRDLVAVIEPQRGRVAAWLNAAPLRAAAEAEGLESDWRTLDTVLNGLALAPDGQSLWLTGKLWPRMYKVQWPPEGLAELLGNSP